MPLLEIRNVSKVFSENGTQFYALKNINLSFPKCGLHFICGKSGSGKSTLLNIISLIEKPSSGDVIFHNQRLHQLSIKQKINYHNKCLSVVFQHYNLFEQFTAEFNVSLPLEIRGVKKEIIKSKVHTLFKQFSMEEYLHKNVLTLSGGEKQRIAIMRSLICEPEIILCDEPTGALDSKNSVVVMELLKEISKKCLVIVVSHNVDLINLYSERTIYLEDGKIIKIDNNDVDFSIQKVTTITDKTNNSAKWINKFVHFNFKKDFKKNITCLIAIIVSLSSTILSIGFQVGSKASLNEYQKRSLSYRNASIQEKTYQDIDGSPLSLVKTKRPLIGKLEFLNNYVPSISYDLNYSSLVSSYPTLYINNVVVDSCSFVPIFSLKLTKEEKNMIIEGNSPIENDLEHVIVNKEFVNKYSLNDTTDQTLIIESMVDIKYPIYASERQYINDSFTFKKEMKISAVVDEFSFMNQPKIYYSYVSLRDYMLSYKFNKISEYLNEKFTAFDLVNESPVNSIYSSYSYSLFVQSYNEMNSFFKIISILENNKEQNLKIDSEMYSVSQAYSGLVDSFSLSMNIFIGIAFFGVIFIFGISSFSSFIKKKKESAIMSILGSSEKNIINIFLYENSLISLIGLSISLVIAYPLSLLGNYLLNGQFGIKNIIQIPYLSFYSVPLLMPLLLLFITLIISFLTTYLPIKFYKNFSLSNELRDE